MLVITPARAEAVDEELGVSDIALQQHGRVIALANPGPLLTRRSLFTGFGLIPALLHRKSARYKSQEVTVYSAHRAFFLWALAARQSFVMRNGFYLLVLWYAGQRFLWEFLKPYATLAGPFNLFHFVSIGLVCYSLVMMNRFAGERATA